ncbi:uncharacterized protein DS421_3g84020 [Arachis hypogaea]|nr:uncharacterized protein LOC112790623 [Arachis hypogaea]QHO57646.1 uncharacterized protein DS421_3g84020 [Arachis hypogaea]
MPGPPTHPGPLDSLLQNAEKTEENSNAAWRKHRSSHLSSPFLNVQPPSPASPSASVAQPLSRRCHFCSIASALQSCPVPFLLLICSDLFWHLVLATLELRNHRRRPRLLPPSRSHCLDGASSVPSRQPFGRSLFLSCY